MWFLPTNCGLLSQPVFCSPGGKGSFPCCFPFNLPNYPSDVVLNLSESKWTSPPPSSSTSQCNLLLILLLLFLLLLPASLCFSPFLFILLSLSKRYAICLRLSLPFSPEKEVCLCHLTARPHRMQALKDFSNLVTPFLGSSTQSLLDCYYSRP